VAENLDWLSALVALVLSLSFFGLVGLTTWYQRRQWPRPGDTDDEEWGAG
jgi:hypothetical protein